MKKPIIEEEVTYDNFKIIEVNGRQIGKSHVSEMIDALIGLLEGINPESVKITNRGPSVGSKGIPTDQQIWDALQALKKSGVEL